MKREKLFNVQCSEFNIPKGFTIIESLVVIGILMLLITMSMPALLNLSQLDLNNGAEEIINNLRLAQNKTLASEAASQYGVYFDISVNPHKYILFQGTSYALRNPLLDEIHNLPQKVEIYEIDLGGAAEVVFERLTGATNQIGSISLRLTTNPSKTKTIYIDGSGKVSLTIPSTPSDSSRIKDSRHTHIDYSRTIDALTEKITLTFTYDTSSVSKDIIVAENMAEGQIYWEGEVDVGGQIQKVKLHTHKFNNPDTQFCIHRDRRYNDKALSITISGDASGTLVEYSADGLSTNFFSMYISNFQWQ